MSRQSLCKCYVISFFMGSALAYLLIKREKKLVDSFTLVDEVAHSDRLAREKIVVEVDLEHTSSHQPDMPRYSYPKLDAAEFINRMALCVYNK